MKLLIVGRGIAGSALARLAVARGHDVTIIAAPERPPASLAALCVIRPDWFKAGTVERDECDWSVGWYRSQRWILTTSMQWTTFRHDGMSLRPGFIGIDSLAPLVTAPEFDLRKGGWGDDRLPHPAEGFDCTVLCRGAWSTLDGKRSWGATTEWRVDGDGQAPMLGFEDRPRNAMFALPRDGYLRFGSSKAADPAMAVNRQIDDEARAAAKMGLPPSNEASHRIVGVRLMPEKGKTPGYIRRLSDKLWAMEGFGRVGYSLAPARAFKLLRQIEQETRQ